jgi:acetylglutamate kinase
MPDPTYLLYLDDYHLEDPVFVQSMARIMQRRDRLPPCLMVHGSGGRAERLVEAEGLFPEAEDGVLQPTSPEEQTLVERGLRQATRQVVGTLVDEVIYAVGFQGADRGLLQRRDDGTLTTGDLGWLETLIDQQAIPVISTMVRDATVPHPVQVPLRKAALALANALDGAVTLVFFTRTGKTGLLDGDAPQDLVGADEVPDDAVAAPEALRAAVEQGLDVLLTSPVGLFGGDDIRGTRVESSR